jgi:hypothetical protein
MITLGTSRLFACLLTWSALATTGFGAEPLTVTDQKGRSIGIELVSLVENTVTFRRQGNPKDFALPINNFDQASQDLIRNQAAKLPAVMPKIQPDVIIGNRRRDVEGSYYMKKQEITCTVKLANLSTTAKVPPITGKIVFIGQNTRTPSLYSVLSSQSFETSINPGETFTKEMDSFFTTYDSDNKGTNNVGGYQYFGYVLVVTDEAGNDVLNESSAGSFRLAMAAKPALLKAVVKYNKGTALTDKLEPAAEGGNHRVPK